MPHYPEEVSGRDYTPTQKFAIILAAAGSVFAGVAVGVMISNLIVGSLTTLSLILFFTAIVNIVTERRSS